MATSEIHATTSRRLPIAEVHRPMNLQMTEDELRHVLHPTTIHTTSMYAALGQRLPSSEKERSVADDHFQNHSKRSVVIGRIAGVPSAYDGTTSGRTAFGQQAPQQGTGRSGTDGGAAVSQPAPAPGPGPTTTEGLATGPTMHAMAAATSGQNTPPPLATQQPHAVVDPVVTDYASYRGGAVPAVLTPRSRGGANIGGAAAAPPAVTSSGQATTEGLPPVATRAATTASGQSAPPPLSTQQPPAVGSVPADCGSNKNGAGASAGPAGAAGPVVSTPRGGGDASIVEATPIRASASCPPSPPRPATGSNALHGPNAPVGAGGAAADGRQASYGGNAEAAATAYVPSTLPRGAATEDNDPCGHPYARPGDRFCGECGLKLVWHCTTAGTATSYSRGGISSGGHMASSSMLPETTHTPPHRHPGPMVSFVRAPPYGDSYGGYAAVGRLPNNYNIDSTHCYHDQATPPPMTSSYASAQHHHATPVSSSCTCMPYALLNSTMRRY